MPPIEEAQRNAVVVLIDDEFLRTPGWLAFLDDVHAAASECDVILGVSLSERAFEVDSPLLDSNLIRLHSVETHLREVVLLNRVTHALCRLILDTDESVLVFLSHAKSDGVAITEKVRAFLQAGTGVDDFFDAQALTEGSRWADVIRGAAARRAARDTHGCICHA